MKAISFNGIKFLKWLLAGFLVVVLLIFSSIAFIVYSETGSRWAIQQAVALINSPQLSIEIGEVEGRLADRLQLRRLKIIQPQQQLTLAELILQWQSAQLINGLLKINQLSLHTLLVVSDSQQDNPAELIQVPDIVLPVDVELQQFELTDFRLAENDEPVIKSLQLSLLANAAQGVTIQQLNLQTVDAAVEGELAMALSSPHPIKGKLHLDGELPELGKTLLAVELSGVALKPSLSANVQMPAQLNLQADVDLTVLQPEIQAIIDWQHLQWPLLEEPQYQLNSGKFQLSGTAENYQLSLNTSVSGQDLPDSELSLQARGGLDSIELQPLKIKTLDGLLQLTGQLSWMPDLSWDLQLLSDAINPGLLQPEWPGYLNADLTVNGGMEQDKPHFDLQIKHLQGELRGYPLSATGGINYRADIFNSENVQLLLGDNQFDISGQVGQQADIQVNIAAQELEQLHPQLAGVIDGQLQLKGNIENPSLLGETRFNNVSFADKQVKSMLLSGNWVGEAGNIKITAEDIALGETRLEQMLFALDGSLASHSINMKTTGLDQDIRITLQGAFANNTWQGQILHTLINNEFISLEQAKAADLEVSAGHLKLGDWCLRNNDEFICLQTDWQQSNDSLQAQLDIRNFDFVHLKPLLPPQGDLQGKLSGNLQMSGTSSAPVIDFDFIPADGQFVLLDDEETLQIPYRNASLKGQFADNQGRGHFNFQIGEKGIGHGVVKIGPSERRELDGELNIDLPELQLVQWIVPDLKDVKGNLAITMKLGGDLDKPLITGQAELKDGRASIPAAGIDVDNIQLLALADRKQHLQLSASMHSGDGRLDLTGEVDASAIPVSLDLALKGENFQVVRLPTADVAISPDLVLSGREVIDIQGKLFVPRAKIELYELPPSVDSVSSDEVIVDQVKPQDANARPVNAKVKLELGDQVSFTGFGLHTGLDGLLDAEYDGKQTQLFGYIAMKDANYQAYGQNLSVEKGRLLFAGIADNPGVDLRAKRLSIDESVTAYLAVNGRLSQPTIRIYSEPSLPEAEALAYLITGRNLSQADKESGNEISAAALSLGLNKAMPALNEMGERLGIDEISFDSGKGDYQDSAIKLGKYLNPDLYIGYTHGLFDANGALMINYSINDYLDLESLSGEEESVDLYYRYEHD